MSYALRWRRYIEAGRPAPEHWDEWDWDTALRIWDEYERQVDAERPKGGRK